MNMQAMLQQAKKMQNDMLKAKKVIDETEYVSKQNFVTVIMLGTKKIKDIKIEIDTNNFDEEDVMALQDMIMLAVNECISKIDEDIEKKLGKAGGMAGLL